MAKDDGTAGEATFLGMVASPDKKDADGAIANQPDGTITIPATVWTIYNPKGNKANYNVNLIDAGWATYGGNTLKTTLKKLVSEVVEKDGDGKVISNLKATEFAELAEVVLPAGQTVLAIDAFKDCKKLATINLANIANYGDNALKHTIITSIDLTNAKTIGASVFEGINTVKTVSIPATVEAIGPDAFKDMYKEGWTEIGGGKDADGDPIDVFHPAQGLEELTFNAYSDATKGFPTIPAAFSGDNLLKKVTITSTKATGFDAGAFAGTASLEELDLSGCTALTEIAAGIFAASPFKSIKLDGTKLKTIENLDLSNANRTLATITLPTTFGKKISATEAFGQDDKFKNFIALTELDLSATQVKEIPGGLFAWSKVDGNGAGTTEKFQANGNPFTPKQYISPALTTVKLNAETTAIGAYAFKDCSALATVEGLNQSHMATIGAYAFDGTAFTALDLSATAVTVINYNSFANMATLTSIKLPANTTAIATGAFAYDKNVTSINLEDLKKLEVLNPIFHEGVVKGSEEDYWYTSGSSWSYMTVPYEKDEVAIPLTSVTLPKDGKLKYLNPGALQLLDIEEIDIPASVEYIGAYSFQGCVKLKKFTWMDAPQSWISENTFRGDDHLEEVKIVTKKYGAGLYIDKSTTSTNEVDFIFKGNDKDVLTFTVNAEDMAILIGQGWTVTNLKYCTLTAEGASEFEFNEKSKTGDYYYATYYSDVQATWFPEENFEVFSAVVEGSNVVMKPATVEGGYYKVPRYRPCIIRSKVQKAEYELKNASFNNISTMPTDNELTYTNTDVTPSRLNYQYMLGVKGGVVAFYRIVKGTIKKGSIYIQANTASDRLNLVLEGDATAIKGINKAGENNGAIYNLQGVRVNKAQKGLYIQNGKKYIMK